MYTMFLLMGLSSLCEVVIFTKLVEKNGGKQCNEQMLTATLTGASGRHQGSEGTPSLVINGNFIT